MAMPVSELISPVDVFTASRSIRQLSVALVTSASMMNLLYETPSASEAKGTSRVVITWSFLTRLMRKARSFPRPRRKYPAAFGSGHPSYPSSASWWVSALER